MTPKTVEEAGAPPLTQPQIDVLERIDELVTKHGCRGMFPRGAGSWQTMRALARRGLVEYVSTGRDMDGEVYGDVCIYDMTDAGRECLRALREAARTPENEDR